jgi:hypothetical protein
MRQQSSLNLYYQTAREFQMSLRPNTDERQGARRVSTRPVHLDSFPTESIFSTTEQKRRFELLRLACFVLRLRKLHEQSLLATGLSEELQREIAFHRNLLQHAIFQQVLTLTHLDAREQAMQIIATGPQQL